jgi:hypothetical protein
MAVDNMLLKNTQSVRSRLSGPILFWIRRQNEQSALICAVLHDRNPHGMDEMSFNTLFTTNAPVIFAFHNNRWLIHTLVHGRSHEGRFHVHGHIDQGTTTTPFDSMRPGNAIFYLR